MSAKKAIVFGCLVLCLGNLLLAALYLLQTHPPTAGPVVLPDGTSVRIADITIGTTHTHGSALARLLNRLPNRLRQPLVKRLPNGGRVSTLTTPDTNLVLWMEYRSPPGLQPSSAKVMLRPAGGMPGGAEAHFSTWFAPGAPKTAVASVRFSAWPRRARDLEAVVFVYTPAQGYVEAGALPFQNPAVYDGPDWNPPPLPAVTNAGDLNVTLLDFASGIGNETEHIWDNDRLRVIYRMRKEEEPKALVRVRFDSPRGTNETWQIFDAALSDVTGNRLAATSRSGMTSDMTFRPILWSGDSAWKLRLQLKRRAGFLPAEQLTFSNIAIPALGSSNRIGQIVSCNGIAVELQSFTRQANLGDRRSWSSRELSRLRVEHPDLGKTNQLDLLDIVVHPYGTNLSSGGASWNETYHEFQIQSIPSGATHLDLRLSVQPTRFAEFMVAPNRVTNDYVVDAE